MTDYVKTRLRKNPKVEERVSPDASYWEKYQTPFLIRESYPITSLEFFPNHPHNLLSTISSRIHIYKSTSPTKETLKVISRFKEPALCVDVRADGQLIAAGDETGEVKIFYPEGRAILRTLKGHNGPVHAVRFSNNKVNLFTASDDNTVKMWDIPTGECVRTFEGHTDYVRSIALPTTNSNILLTGSYDHTVKVYDTRTSTAPIFTLDHGQPVESTLIFPGEGCIASAGGPTIKIWSLHTGQCLRTLNNFQKTVTCLRIGSGGSRLLAGSLDGSVKLFEVEGYNVVYNMKFGGPIMSMAIAPNDLHLAVGLSTGAISVRSREIKDISIASITKDLDQSSHVRHGTYAWFMRGGTGVGQDDVEIIPAKRPKLKMYDHYLRKFRYSDALDVVLIQPYPSLVVCSVIEELMSRPGAIDSAISGRTEQSLEPLLKFCLKNIDKPDLRGTVSELVERLLVHYGNPAPSSPILHSYLQRLTQKVTKEITFQKNLMEFVGSLDTVLANSSWSISVSEVVVQDGETRVLGTENNAISHESVALNEVNVDGSATNGIKDAVDDGIGGYGETNGSQMDVDSTENSSSPKQSVNGKFDGPKRKRKWKKKRERSNDE
ncbi:WD40-repeat-containing domain protein [Paraphysoderma sedebokerense]|nr:WD40-repeat-containing domain protein [Paraphysoderma sedebokerense]